MHYLPLTPQDEKEILTKLGVSSYDELIAKIIPPELRYHGSLELPEARSEHDVRRIVGELAQRNVNTSDYLSFLGGGIYDHYIPAIIDSIISRSEFYTAYTPYQAEVSQGTLQTIFEYQSAICELTGMPAANASMYDGGSALAEACHMACMVTNRHKIILPETVHPFYRQVVRTYTRECGVNIVSCPAQGVTIDREALKDLIDADTGCVVVQHPNYLGYLEQCADIEPLAHGAGALLIVCADPLSLGVIAPPGEYGADIAVGEGQALGIAQGCGGPLLGFFAAKMDYVRFMPGRIVGETTDVEGRRAYTLTLQTREQHIRREKATSNICTNEALCALSALIYLCTLGKQGIIDVGNLCVSKSHYLYNQLKAVKGVKPVTGADFFKEFVVETAKPAAEIVDRLLERKILAGVPLERLDGKSKNHLLVAVTEKRSKVDMDRFASDLAKVA